MQIYNLKNKLEYLDEVAKLEYDEWADNKELNTIEKLIQKVNKIGIPVYTNNYFVKKAEIELDKIIRNYTNLY